MDDGVDQHRPRHPFTGTKAALAAAAQQLSVVPLHHEDAIFDEPDRLPAKGRCSPCAAGNGAGSVKGLSDLAIASSGKTTVKRAGHGKEALPQPSRDCPSARHGSGPTTSQAAAKAQQAGQPAGNIVVERHESSQPRATPLPAQPQTVCAVGVLQDDMTAVRRVDGN